jgi:hypothetical protein
MRGLIVCVVACGGVRKYHAEVKEANRRQFRVGAQAVMWLNLYLFDFRMMYFPTRP